MDPIRAYSLQVGPSATKAVPRPEPAASTSVGKWSALAALVLAVIVGAGWWGWNSQFVAISGPPMIAVLPLANMSGDPGLQYIADGTTENLIATLSRSPQIKVVARTSTDAYKGKSVDIRQIGKELGARYVLEGSVQKSADKLRIVAQLIDARNGEHVWAEHFDRQSSDPLALQDEVTDSIVRTLAGDTGLIKKKQYEDEWGKDTARLDEWDYYLRGHELFIKYNRDDMDKAVQIWEEGLRKYPNSSLLKVKLGWASYMRWLNGWTADAERESQTAIRYAQEALAANRASPLAVGLAHWLRGDQYGDWRRLRTSRERIDARDQTHAIRHGPESRPRLLSDRSGEAGRGHSVVGLARATSGERSVGVARILVVGIGAFYQEGLRESR